MNSKGKDGGRLRPSVGGVALPGASGREPRVLLRQMWGELRRPPRPAAVPGAASVAFVIPELQLLASSRPFPPSTLWRSLALRSRGWGSWGGWGKVCHDGHLQKQMGS